MNYRRPGDLEERQQREDGRGRHMAERKDMVGRQQREEDREMADLEGGRQTKRKDGNHAERGGGAACTLKTSP